MSLTTINIIAFDIPYPASYGGSMDIFYKLKTLHEKGINLILHCFKYNKPEQAELEKYCEQVFYYRRKKGAPYLISPLPYIVSTRKNGALLKNLQTNKFPILFEGLHTCAFLAAPELKHRIKIVRTHNIEHHYYKGLQRSSGNMLKKIYYGIESRKLKRFETILKHATHIAAISPNDFEYFSERLKSVSLIPAFHPFSSPEIKPGKGEYFLYHGNLSVEENDRAAGFLLNKVFSKSDAKLIIAGKNPGKKLLEKITRLSNVKVEPDPTEKRMTELLQNAQACVLPTFQGTGLKLKLLISLFSSRFVIANKTMVGNTGLENLCEIANSAEEIIAAVNKISKSEFTSEEVKKRSENLKQFSTNFNGEKLIKIIRGL